MREKDYNTTPVLASRVLKKIAIVDDEASVCFVLSILVSKLGYSADFIASDGTEILEAVRAGAASPDLVIMDYRMPVMNGIEAARAILKEKPASRIIIESADDTVKQIVLGEGMLFLQKPFNRKQLAKIIDEAFSLAN